ncbi:hypothetical protein DSO57_1026654 [Entomophthora muscae]|uniref:Uncharacterized protein n=1 Tax=Entomophthora muscae TaxID=34485 RepID=A0ACC2RGP2_9FUNG|nr:hypothetical protein DSO57_1026654 [Entomophthora muscae]
MKFFKATLISLVSAKSVNEAFDKVGSTRYLDFAGVQPQSVNRSHQLFQDCSKVNCHLDTSINKKAYLYLKFEDAFIFNNQEINSLLTSTSNKLDYIGVVFDFRKGKLGTLKNTMEFVIGLKATPKPVIILKLGARSILGDYIVNLFNLLRNGDKLFIRFAREDYDHVNSKQTWGRIENKIAELNKGPYELSLTTENDSDARELKSKQYGVRIVIEELENIDTSFSSNLNVC